MRKGLTFVNLSLALKINYKLEKIPCIQELVMFKILCLNKILLSFFNLRTIILFVVLINKTNNNKKFKFFLLLFVLFKKINKKFRRLLKKTLTVT